MEGAALSTPLPFVAGPAVAVETETDAALMERVRGGETEAFEPLVRRYQQRLFGYFLNATADASTAADLAQETFVRVFRAAPRYRESGRFEAWLFRIAANLARSDARRRVLRRRLFVPESPEDEGPIPNPPPDGSGPDNPDDPENAARASEVREALRRALPRVPPVFREAVLLRDVEGWSYREIAEMLGIEEGTVKSRAHRGRKRLRELLSPQLRTALA